MHLVKRSLYIVGSNFAVGVGKNLSKQPPPSVIINVSVSTVKAMILETRGTVLYPNYWSESPVG